MSDKDFPIALDQAAKLRLEVISEEMGYSIHDLIRISAEEAALKYFRDRDDDPAAHIN